MHVLYSSISKDQVNARKRSHYTNVSKIQSVWKLYNGQQKPYVCFKLHTPKWFPCQFFKVYIYIYIYINITRHILNFFNCRLLFSLTSLISLSRYQHPWALGDDSLTRSGPLWSKYLGIETEDPIIEKFMVQNGPRRPISSHDMFDIRDAITRTVPFRPSQFLEEKKWPPREMINGNHSNIIRRTSQSELSFSHADNNINSYVAQTKANTNQLFQLSSTLSTSTDPLLFNSNCYEPKFDTFSQLEVTTPLFFFLVLRHCLFIEPDKQILIKFY